jgi:hypothetical protein
VQYAAATLSAGKSVAAPGVLLNETFTCERQRLLLSKLIGKGQPLSNPHLLMRCTMDQMGLVNRDASCMAESPSLCNSAWAGLGIHLNNGLNKARLRQ